MTIIIYIIVLYVIIGVLLGLSIGIPALVRQIRGTAHAKNAINFFIAVIVMIPIINIIAATAWFSMTKEPKRLSWEEIHEYINPKT